ncbi:MAG: proteasome-type protease [Pseudomonadota bacterium]
MTYCVGLRLKCGLVFMSDTRTNAGVDNISVFPKMFHWEAPGERALTLMTAGNLATTQSVVSLLNERALPAEERGVPSLLEVPSMFRAAELVGQTLREVIAGQTDEGQTAEAFSGTMILGGQIRGGAPRLFLVYPEGNFIEVSDEMPFFQIGETKYGKPIIVRTLDAEMSFEQAVKLLMLSFDSTIKANLSVGLPLDLHLYEADSFALGTQRRIAAGDAFFEDLSSGWSDALRRAFDELPDYALD